MEAATEMAGALGLVAGRSPSSLSRSSLGEIKMSQESGFANGVTRFAPKIRPATISSGETIGASRRAFGLISAGEWPDHQC